MRVYILIFSLLTSMYGKNATIQIFSDVLDWETILKSRSDFIYTSYNVQDDGFLSGEFQFSLSAYFTNQPNISFSANTVLDIQNFRKDENGDGIYDILDPGIKYQDSFTGTESGTYYENSSYLGAVNFGTTFFVTRDVGQSYINAKINGVVTSSSIQGLSVGESSTLERDYYTLGWSGYLEYGTNNYSAVFSNNETGTAYSGSSQITKTNENSITLKSFPLPGATGNTSANDITLERQGKLYHKQLVTGGITYYFRILDTEDSDNDGIPDISDSIPKSLFSSTQSIGNGWNQHYKFGTFFSFLENEWCYHSNLGWIYVPDWNDGGTWMYRPNDSGGQFPTASNFNWVWTTTEIYPYLYSSGLERWLYVGRDKLFLWSKSDEQWSYFDVERGGIFTLLNETFNENEEWNANYEQWLQSPDLYGGELVLKEIKKAKYDKTKELNLYNMKISNISPLSDLVDLEKLSLDSNNISDLSSLSGLNKLEFLELDQNDITDISIMSNLTTLTDLWLSQNNISNLDPLSSLKNLENLSLIDCNISDLSPLTALSNLKILYLWNNPINDSQKVMLEKALPNTEIYW